MKKLADLILGHPKTFLAVLLVATAAIALFSRRLEFDASIKSFILENDPDYEFYRQYREKFGQDEILVVAFEDKENLFTPANLAAIGRLTHRIEDVENVYDVRSLTNVEYMRNSGESFDVVPIVREEQIDDPAALDKQKQIAIDNPILRQDIISPDGRKTSILVTLAAKEKGYRYENEITAIEDIVRDESRQLGKPLYLAGERYLDHRFVRYMHRDLKIFIPATCAALGLLLFLIFRNIRETAIGLAAISLCLMWAMGLIPLTGWKMNSVIAGLPSLVLCIAVTDVVHIMHRYRRLLRELGDRDAALRRTFREVGWPCLLTSLTTAIGFGSLVLNGIHPIRGFGVVSAIAVSVSFGVCIVFVPAALLLWKERPAAATRDAHLVPPALIARLTEFLIRRRRLSWAIVLAVVTLCGAGAMRVKTQVNRVRYLKTGSDVYQSIQFIDRNLAGTTELDISLESPVKGHMKDPEVLARVEKLVAFLRAQPEIDKVISLNDFIKEMNKAFNEDRPEFRTIPDSRGQVAELLLLYSMSGNRNELARYVDYNYTRTRVSVRTAEQNSARLDRLIGRINGYLAANFGGSLQARMASAAQSNNNVFHYLIKGLMLGLGAAIVLVGLVMCVNLRSLYAGAVSMIPNVLPVIVCLGFMGWCGIWLEIATAMTFSIAIGIAVDDTIHLMSRFRLELERNPDHTDALRATMSSVGSSLVETTLIISGGFLILTFASLKMNIVFGLLCALIMLVALVADLVVTPLCLLTFRPFKTRPIRDEEETQAADKTSAHPIDQPVVACCPVKTTTLWHIHSRP